MFTRINRFNEALRDMILTCPECATQYRLKDGAIPPEGRTVRCAACKHKWHQDGDAGSADVAPASNDPGVTAAPDAPRDEEIGIAPPQPDQRDAEPPVADVPEAAAAEQMIAEEPQPQVPEQFAASETVGDDAARSEYAPVESATATEWDEPQAAASDDYGFAAIPAMHDEDEPRRGGKLGWILGLVLLVVVAAAAFWFLAPADLKARVGIAEAGTSPLQLMLTTSSRQPLASGNDLVAISGRVINSTERSLVVPPINAELRDPANKLVYHWTIPLSVRSLAPGESAIFNSAEIDVPKSGKNLSLRFAG